MQYEENGKQWRQRRIRKESWFGETRPLKTIKQKRSRRKGTHTHTHSKIQWDCARSNVCSADFVCKSISILFACESQWTDQPIWNCIASIIIIYAYDEWMNEWMGERISFERTNKQFHSKTATCIQWIISSIWFDPVSVSVCSNIQSHTKSIPQSTFFHIPLPIHIMFNLYSNADADTFANVMEFTHVCNNIYCVLCVCKFCIQHIPYNRMALFMRISKKRAIILNFHIYAPCVGGSFCEFDFIIIRLTVLYFPLYLATGDDV